MRHRDDGSCSNGLRSWSRQLGELRRNLADDTLSGRNGAFIFEQRPAEATRLRLVLAASRLGDWSWNALTDVVTFSDRAAEMFGIPPGPHMTWSEMQSLIHPEDRDRARREVERVIAEAADDEIEYRLIGDGREGRWILATGRALHAPDGRVIGMLGVVRDISDRKALTRREQELRVTAELLNRVGPTLAGELDLKKLTQSVTRLGPAAGRRSVRSALSQLPECLPAKATCFTGSPERRRHFPGFQWLSSRRPSQARECFAATMLPRMLPMILAVD